MIAALDDAGGGDERELRVLLTIGDRGHAAVAHGGFCLLYTSTSFLIVALSYRRTKSFSVTRLH